MAAVALVEPERGCCRALRDAVGHTELQRAAGGVRRAVRVEALLIVAVLGVTGFLTNQSPRDEPPRPRAAPTGSSRPRSVTTRR